ncbi:hypothetical protein ACQPYH_30405 [Kribbella sp. CA-245084]|uniref:hypothetical protein n=1 Tax=Kribbella sp. CA-245084 TaxID=3239940 RepID=UPI003D918962
MCGTTAAGLTSEKLRMARRQLVWSAGPSEFVSEEQIVYQQGGDSYAVPVGNRLLVVLWSNWTGSSSEPAAIRSALAKARTVVVQREQRTLQALAG